MKFVRIAHYGGYLTNALDTYSRRQLRHGHALRKVLGASDTLLKHQLFRRYCVADRLLRFEQRRIESWRRLIAASKISRARAKSAA